MAGNWIKWTKGLTTKREVLALANAMETDRSIVVVMLMEFWEWADDNTDDGHIRGVTMSDIDAIVRFDGFAKHLIGVHWLKKTRSGMSIPNFDRHNGKSAKARVLDAERKRRSRTVSGFETDKLRTRVEKKRVEEKREKKSNEIQTNTSASTRGGSTTEQKKLISVLWSPQSGWQGLTDADHERWAHTYPACDVERQLRSMDDWLRSNPTKAHKSNWLRFITNWLKREQDRGGDAISIQQRPGYYDDHHRKSRVSTPRGKYDDVACKL